MKRQVFLSYGDRRGPAGKPKGAEHDEFAMREVDDLRDAEFKCQA